VQAHARTGIADIGASAHAFGAGSSICAYRAYICACAHAIGTNACIRVDRPCIGTGIHTGWTDACACSCHITDMSARVDSVGADSCARAHRADMGACVDAIGTDTHAGTNAKHVNSNFRGVSRAT
jgi:hypothetical protein